MNHEDRAWFAKIIDDKFTAHLEPIRKNLERHEHLLFGVNGDGGGLLGDMKVTKKRLRILEVVSYTVQGVIGAVLAFKEKIFG